MPELPTDENGIEEASSGKAYKAEVVLIAEEEEEDEAVEAVLGDVEDVCGAVEEDGGWAVDDVVKLCRLRGMIGTTT